MNNLKMIFGAPGCGKTTYLITLLESLLQEYEPNEIAFVSFTRKGSYEGRDRAIEQFGFKEEDFPYFRTIHSIAFRELGVSKYEMISKRHYRDFSKAMGMNFLGYYTEDLINNDDKYLFFCSLYRNNPHMADRLALEINWETFRMVNRNYQRYKKELGILDFDDLLVEFVQSRQSLPVKVAIIDEAQDLTSLQWQFCELAFKGCEKVYVAGDDDQAIYEWSGADIKRFLSMTDSSYVHILDKSWRLRSNILQFSKKVAKKISHRVQKDFWPRDEGGTIQFYNRLEDVTFNSEESYYLLSRNNYFLRGYTEHLMKKGLVFHHKNKLSVDKDKYEAVKRFEYLRKTNVGAIKSDKSLKPYLRKDRSYNAPWYEVFDMDIKESNYFRDLFRDKTDVNQSKIMVNTIHGVKGGEADNVVLKLDITRNVSKAVEQNMDAELRCLYVALTRAKRHLHIVHSNSKFSCRGLLDE